MIPATEPQPLGEWLPDLGLYNNVGCTMALNVTTRGENYTPFGETLAGSNPLPDTCKGGFSYRDTEGNVTIFAGTKTGIYKLDGLNWVEVTRGIGTTVVPYTTGDDGFWDFLNFGPLVIVTNYNDDIQVFDMSSSTEFEQLSASAPRCRRMFIYKNFLVCVDTVDGDGAVGYRVRWSPIGNPRGDWTDLEVQADFQDIFGGDFANAFGAGLQDYAVIVQGKNLVRMDYVGPNSGIFSFTPIDTGRGSILPRACIANGRSIFFPSEDGFYEYNGAELIAIGNNKWDKYFYGQFDESYDYNMNVQIDQIKKNVLWSFPSKDAVGGQCDKILCFNWVDRRGTLVNQEADVLFTFLTVGYTLDSLDGLYDNIDEIPFSLDSRIWTGGKTILGCFSSDHKLSAFNGPPKTAKIVTSQVRPNIDGMATLHSIIPYVEGGDLRGRLGTKKKVNDAEQWTDYVSQNQYTGEIDFLKHSTYFRAEIELSGQWENAVSIAYRAAATGAA